MKILLIKYRNIGDILLSSALISNLRFHFPDSIIDYALNKSCEEMIIGNPAINKIISYDRDKVKSFGFFKQLSEEIENILYIRKQKYDLVINLTEGDRGALISLLSKANYKLGYKNRKGIMSKIKVFDKLANGGELLHSVDRDLQFISLLGKDVEVRKVSIYWDNEVETDVNKIIDMYQVTEFVHIHPVSRWMFKCWEDDRMAKAIDYLSLKKKYSVVLTCSDEKHEKERINKIIQLCKSNPINLAGELSLKQVSYLSSKSKFFFGIDSAPMHIAASNNTPVVAIMGASEASKWGPWSNNSKNVYFNKGIQKNSKHIIFADDNHSILYVDGIKKCQGMLNIKLDSVIEVLNEYY